jgi:hypothetical protein
MKSGKGSILSAQVVHSPMHLYGVSTTWAVMLHIQSPTGDSSDTIQLTMPCTSREQACSIADGYNEEVAPYLLGVFDENYEREEVRIDTPLLTRKI